LDFWNNLSVNLLSNVIWFILAYAAAQFVKRAFARSTALAAAAPPVAEPPVTATPSIAHERLLDTCRRVLRSTFAFVGLLVVLLVTCASFAESAHASQHVLGWCGVVVAWLIWSWSIRDPRLTGKVYRGHKPAWMRYTLASFAACFWLAILGGLVVIVYGVP
jgi:hypothetical protein